MTIKRSAFYTPRNIYEQTRQKLSEMGDEPVDYLSFVPDGEPTLDIRLGEHIDLLRPLGIKIAVITNASLLWMEDVQQDLLKADWVSLKVDAATVDVWKKIDRPHGALDLDRIIEGATNFSERFSGERVTETMLVRDINDDESHLKSLAKIIAAIRPEKAYVLVPTRPPAESGISKPTPETLRNAYDIYRQAGLNAECVTGDDVDTFYFTDDVANDLLSISSVHPVREDIVMALLRKRDMDRSVIDRLVEKDLIRPYRYDGKVFYRRNL
jgi:wyosine [tRNA(Phe)-imidazoG37] synthetase (radical SAM superfamily)